MDALARVIARDEIRQLVFRYALATDRRDLDALVDLFIPDVQVGRDRFGRDALREDFDVRLRDVGVTILFVGNHVIDFDDGLNARGEVYCRAEVQRAEQWIEQAILYRDQYRFCDGAWRFARREHLLWYGRDAAESPLSLAPANWPENHTGLGSLPNAWQSWRDFWAE